MTERAQGEQLKLSGEEFINSVPWRHDELDHERRGLLRTIENVARSVDEINSDTLIIAICGQSGLGKSAFSFQLARYIGRPNNVVDLDTYLKPRGWRQIHGISGPAQEANDVERACSDISTLLTEKVMYFPYYSHETGRVGETFDNPEAHRFSEAELRQKAGYTVSLLSRDYLILEGVSPFFGDLAGLSHLKIFITTTEGLQLAFLDKTQVEGRKYSEKDSYVMARQKIDDFRRVAPVLEEMADIVIVCKDNYRYEIARIKNVLGEKYPRLSPEY